MNTGKLSELITGRSIWNRCVARNPQVSVGQGAGVDAAVLRTEGALVTATAAAGSFDYVGTIGENKELQILAMRLKAGLTAWRAVNSVAAAGGSLCGLSDALILPKGMKEQWLRMMIDELESVAEQNNVSVIGGHSEVSSDVRQPVMTVTAYGTARGEFALHPHKGKTKKLDLVMTGFAGMEGTGVLASFRGKELQTRFRKEYLERAYRCIEQLSVVPAAVIAEENGAVAMHDLSESGVLGGLWEFGEQMDCGLTVHFEAIPIMQETIEITEYFETNPYLMPSAGALLIACEDGERMKGELESRGIESAIIGRTSESRDRVVIHKDERSFLNQPR